MLSFRPHQGQLMYKGQNLEPGTHYNIDYDARPHHEPVITFRRIDEYKKIYEKPLVIPYSCLKRYGFQYWEPTYPRYLSPWLNVHENQYLAGRDIIEHYQSGIKDVILVAQMQSGKTGTARYVTHAMLHCTDIDQERQITGHDMYFICGMNDNDLRSQAIREFAGLIPEKNILFSKQLQAINKLDSLPSAYFIIIDESHYAGNTGSQVDKFMKHVQPKCAHIYTLSVSATPMAELASSTKYGKGCVVLRPGPHYYGIKDIFATGQILQSVDVTNNQQSFCDLVAEQYELQHENLDYKYNIVRLPSQWYYRDLEDELNTLELNIKYINHHTCDAISVDDFNKYVENKPTTTTIIWIYGSLRAGKQLNTKHIGFVHDTSASAPDTIAQSLLGRIMGYRKEGNGVTCFTDMNAAHLMLEWVNKHYDISWIPQGSRGVLNGYSDKVLPWQLHVPIGLQLSPDATCYYRELKMKHRNRYPFKEDLMMDILLTSGDQRTKIDNIFETYTPSHSGGLTIMTEFNADHSYLDHWIHNYQCYSNGQPTRGFDANPDNSSGKYYHIYVNLNRGSPQYGLVLITYKEYINGKIPANYVRVTNKSRFV